MRIVTTGTRHLEDTPCNRLVVSLALATSSPHEAPEKVAHGNGRGCDQIVDKVVTRLWGIEAERFPADWDAYGTRAGPLRNRRMIEAVQPHLVLAFWDGRKVGCGTYDTFCHANALNIEVRIIPIPR